MKGQKDLPMLCQSLKDLLSKMGLGYGNSEGFSMRVSPDPFTLTGQEFSTLERRGPLYWEWLRGVNKVYQEGLTNPQLKWLSTMFEKGLSPAMIAVQRSVLGSTPRLLRCDQSSITATCEVQVPMSLGAWGFCQGIILAYPEVFSNHCFGNPVGDLIQGFLQAMRLSSGKENPVIFIPQSPKKQYQKAEDFFIRKVAEQGGKIICAPLEILQDQERAREIDLIYPSSRHRCDEKAAELMLALMEKGVTLEPPPNLLFDQKIAIILPFLPESRDFFSDEVRALFPEARLVGKRDLELADLPASKRKEYILKYAGLDPRQKSGGVAVFRFDGSRKEAKRLLERAVQATMRDDYWILQKLVREKRTIRFWDEEKDQIKEQPMYYRFNPFYLREENDEIRLFGSVVCTSTFWKVGGRYDSVIQEVRIGDS
ncbi:hypothetical protein KKC60_04100 [Patescibacteria group bacterium]|nr:hypothetical protein [Patescibacteria group bacterium]